MADIDQLEEFREEIQTLLEEFQKNNEINKKSQKHQRNLERLLRQTSDVIDNGNEVSQEELEKFNSLLIAQKQSYRELKENNKDNKRFQNAWRSQFGKEERSGALGKRVAENLEVSLGEIRNSLKTVDQRTDSTGALLDFFTGPFGNIIRDAFSGFQFPNIFQKGDKEKDNYAPKIKGQFDSGGSVPARGTYLLDRGEYVLSKNQTDEVSDGIKQLYRSLEPAYTKKEEDSRPLSDLEEQQQIHNVHIQSVDFDVFRDQMMNLQEGIYNTRIVNPREFNQTFNEQFEPLFQTLNTNQERHHIQKVNHLKGIETAIRDSNDELFFGIFSAMAQQYRMFMNAPFFTSGLLLFKFMKFALGTLIFKPLKWLAFGKGQTLEQEKLQQLRLQTKLLRGERLTGDDLQKRFGPQLLTRLGHTIVRGVSKSQIPVWSQLAQWQKHNMDVSRFAGFEHEDNLVTQLNVEKEQLNVLQEIRDQFIESRTEAENRDIQNLFDQKIDELIQSINTKQNELIAITQQKENVEPKALPNLSSSFFDDTFDLSKIIDHEKVPQYETQQQSSDNKPKQFSDNKPTDNRAFGLGESQTSSMTRGEKAQITGSELKQQEELSDINDYSESMNNQLIEIKETLQSASFTEEEDKDGILGKLGGWIKGALGGALAGVFTRGKGGIGKLFKGLLGFKGFKNFGGILKGMTSMKGFLTGLKGLFKVSPIGWLVTGVLSVYEVVKAFMSNDTWKGKITGALAGIANVFLEIPRMLYNWIVQPILGFFNIDLPKMPNLKPYVKKIFGFIWDTVGVVFNVVKSIFGFVGPAISKIFGGVKSIFGFLSPIFGGIVSAVKSIFGGISSTVNGISNFISGLKEKISNIPFVGGLFGGEKEEKKKEEKEEKKQSPKEDEKGLFDKIHGFFSSEDKQKESPKEKLKESPKVESSFSKPYSSKPQNLQPQADSRILPTAKIEPQKETIKEAPKEKETIKEDKSFVSKGISSIKSLVGNTLNAYKLIWGYVEGTMNVYKSVFSAIKDGIVATFGFVKKQLEFTTNVVKGFVKNTIGVITSIYNGFTSIWESTKNIIGDTIGNIKSFVGSAFDKVKPFFDGIKNVIQGIYNSYQSIWNYVKGTFSTTSMIIKEIFNIVKGTFSSFKSAWDYVKGTINFASSIVKSVFNGIANFMKGIKNKLAGLPFVGGLFGDEKGKEKEEEPKKSSDNEKGFLSKISSFFDSSNEEKVRSSPAKPQQSNSNNEVRSVPKNKVNESFEPRERNIAPSFEDSGLNNVVDTLNILDKNSNLNNNELIQQNYQIAKNSMMMVKEMQKMRQDVVNAVKETDKNSVADHIGGITDSVQENLKRGNI